MLTRLFLSLFLLLTAGFAAAQDSRNLQISKTGDKRVALVIGNSAYTQGPLTNPVNDARAIAAKVKGLGFEVIYRENMTTKQIGGTLREFRARLTPGAEALFFYAGHGLQVSGKNYLLAVDADILGEEDVPTQSIELSKVLEVMQNSKTRLNLVFLDACRNNPFSRRFRSTAAGLVKVDDAPSGTILSFATRPGGVADDGDGINGLYTQHLLEAMDEKGIPIEQSLKNVLRGVKKASKGKQEPWWEGGIEGNFFFIEGPVTVNMAVKPTAFDLAQIELSFWDSIKASQDRADFDEYLRQYPKGSFAGIAKNRIRQLGLIPIARKRVALVVGNSAYVAAQPLGSPVNDARAVAVKLRGLGFDVIERADITSQQIEPTLREFKQRLSPDSEALFYYAGLGFQLNGLNYLPAIDAVFRTENDVLSQSISVASVLELLEKSKTRINLVFLDACRNEPFSRRFRGVNHMMAIDKTEIGTIVSFSAQKGSVGTNCDGSNGIYAEHLLRAMDQKGIPIEQVLKNVVAGVKVATSGTQVPSWQGYIEGNFYFK